MRKTLTVTVSQLNRYVRALLEEDPKLADLYVKGEISNYTRHYRSGHLYFSLKDEGGSVKAVMFQSNARDLRFEPENGMAVILRARIGVYERDGVYQLYVTDIQPHGAGALAVAFEQRKEKLAAMGLFDPEGKKPLPPYPRRIGVVTSETGAALQDIVNVLGRRYPLAALVLSPAVVQGEEAAPSVKAALEALDQRGGCDVIIVGRGGGSAEDLWGFNDEALALAVHQAQTPVISAVGHETDYTILDFVADLRAPTPSAAAELATPCPMEELGRRLSQVGEGLERGARQRLGEARLRLARLRDKRCLRSPMDYVQRREETLDFFTQSMYNKKCIFIRSHTQALQSRLRLLDSLGPLRVLERGYSVALAGEKPVTSVSSLQTGDTITVRFRDGEAVADVKEIRREDNR